MPDVYARDLDLNLLRVFVVVADAGSVTGAAARLYLTQPAVSASLKRLAQTIGAPLFVRQGRGVVLTARGSALLEQVRPHLEALVASTSATLRFDPKTTDRTVRLGLGDANELWLLPPLLRALDEVAPNLRVIVLPVQFRTVGELLTSGRVDLALTIADEVPASVSRQTLFDGGAFVSLYDPRHSTLGPRPSLERYLAAPHVIVSYNGDLRGIIEDLHGAIRNVRCAVSSFHLAASLVDGSARVATLPKLVATHVLALRPHLRTARVPLSLGSVPMELLVRRAIEDDPAVRLVRETLSQVVEEQVAALSRPQRNVRKRSTARGSRVRRSALR